MWGNGPTHEQQIDTTDTGRAPRRIVGFEEPVGYLDTAGMLSTLSGRRSPHSFEDVAILGSGRAVALRGELAWYVTRCS